MVYLIISKITLFKLKIVEILILTESKISYFLRVSDTIYLRYENSLQVFEGDDGERFEKNWLYWTGARMLYR